MGLKPPLNLRVCISFAMILGLSFSVMGSQAFAIPKKSLTDEQLTKNECSDCHFFYSREFLPAFSWKKIIDNLPNHFGEDASLDAKTRERILSYLAGIRSTEVPIRITDLSWWKQRHGSNIKTYAARKHIHVSNCGRCHRQ